MSDYTKSTNFASKDSLSSGNPLKIVKGTELDTEFNNISTAVATKADLASPALTGTPTAPTASFSTNTTQLATTAFVQAALAAIYPVGSIYTNATNSTNPGTLLGFGTWTAFGSGRVPVGYDSGDSSFNSAEKTGGSKDAITVSHTHSITDSGHQHSSSIAPTSSGIFPFGAGGTINGGSYGGAATGSAALVSSETTGISINSAGSSGTNANLPPYITVYMWKRTA